MTPSDSGAPCLTERIRKLEFRYAEEREGALGGIRQLDRYLGLAR